MKNKKLNSDKKLKSNKKLKILECDTKIVREGSTITVQTVKVDRPGGGGGGKPKPKTLRQIVEEGFAQVRQEIAHIVKVNNLKS